MLKSSDKSINEFHDPCEVCEGAKLGNRNEFGTEKRGRVTPRNSACPNIVPQLSGGVVFQLGMKFQLTQGFHWIFILLPVEKLISGFFHRDFSRPCFKELSNYRDAGDELGQAGIFFPAMVDGKVDGNITITFFWGFQSPGGPPKKSSKSSYE